MGIFAKIPKLIIAIIVAFTPVAQPPEIVYEMFHPAAEEYFYVRKNTKKNDTRDYVKDPVIAGKFPEFDHEKLAASVVYPKYAKQNNIQGRVVVVALIDTLGRALKVRIESSANEYLNKSALEAVMNWEYIPAKEKNGNKVVVYVSIPINFRLKEK